MTMANINVCVISLRNEGHGNNVNDVINVCQYVKAGRNMYLTLTQLCSNSAAGGARGRAIRLYININVKEKAISANVSSIA